MSDEVQDLYDPYKEMSIIYRLDDPTEEQQFRFVEAMKYLVETAYFEGDIVAFSFNLAMYYRDIKEFELEKKYLEIGAEYDEDACKEELGLIWYYGLTGEQDYEKAYHYFVECDTRRSRYMIADMYHDGHYVDIDRKKCREIIEALFNDVALERNDPVFRVSTLFPEIATRLVKLNIEENKDNESALDYLIDARKLLTIRQKNRPFWGNIKAMRKVLETIAEMYGTGHSFLDLYDLMTYEAQNAVVTFDYDGEEYKLIIFQNEGETIYQFEDRWYHGADDFLEKARIDGKRITTVMWGLDNIKPYQV